MNPKKIYQFCMRCGSRLKFIIKNELCCNSCGFKHHINPIPSNAVIIENKNGEILLVKRKYPPKKGWWDLPGGFIQPNESIEESVQREIKEELGVNVAIIRLIGIYTDTYLYQKILEPTLITILLAKIVSGKLTASDDVAGYKFYPKKAILKEKIAFKSAMQGLTDYLYIRLETSLPNLTA